MVQFENVKNLIDAYIRQNGQQLITGQLLNNVLNDLVSVVDQLLTSTNADVEEAKRKVAALSQEIAAAVVTVDQALNAESPNPIANRAVSAALTQIETASKDLFVALATIDAAKTSEFVDADVKFSTVDGKKSLDLSIGLVIQPEISQAAEKNGLVTAQGVKSYVESMIVTALNTEV